MTRLLLILLLFLSSGPAYAEWMWIDDKAKDGMTTYANPDSIRRKGDLVKMEVLFDFRTAEHVADTTHLSFMTQDEYDCTEGRSRRLAGTFFSGNMGSGKVVYNNSTKDKWKPVPPESVNHDLWKVACGKGQSSRGAPASPPINTSFEDLQTLQTQAAQGDAKAQYFLGVLYAKGLEVPQDSREALKWFRLSAAQGNADAQSTLGAMYNHGTGVPQDSREAVKWFRLSAAQGNADAQYNLGVSYANGYGVPQDSAEALKWFRLAAAQGDAGGQYNLGLLYARGQGVHQDPKEALRWFRLSAAQEHMGAQYNLGVMYLQGQGVPQDSTEALKRFRLAAVQGHVEAQNNLGLMYAMGQGVPQDYVRAHMWFSLSAAHSIGDEQKLAADNRDDVVRRMTPEQIAKAQRLSQQCQTQQFKGC